MFLQKLYSLSLCSNVCALNLDIPVVIKLGLTEHELCQRQVSVGTFVQLLTSWSQTQIIASCLRFHTLKLLHSKLMSSKSVLGALTAVCSLTSLFAAFIYSMELVALRWYI